MARSLGLILDISFAGFVAVVDAEDKVLAQRWRPPGDRYDDVGDWIEGCLQEAGGSLSDLGWIAVGVGPGSFTGIRIAMAFAQGLAMPRNIPLYGFTAFTALLLSCETKPGQQLVAAIPSNSGRFYTATDLKESGALVEADRLSGLGNPEAVLVIPSKVPAMEPILSKFNQVHVVEGNWDVPRLVQHAKTSGLDAFRPYYLQLSAAEEKAGA